MVANKATQRSTDGASAPPGNRKWSPIWMKVLGLTLMVVSFSVLGTGLVWFYSWEFHVDRSMRFYLFLDCAFMLLPTFAVLYLVAAKALDAADAFNATLNEPHEEDETSEPIEITARDRQSLIDHTERNLTASEPTTAYDPHQRIA